MFSHVAAHYPQGNLLQQESMGDDEQQVAQTPAVPQTCADSLSTSDEAQIDKMKVNNTNKTESLRLRDTLFCLTIALDYIQCCC